MARRLGLATLLVERGLLPDVRTASSWIMARKVRVGHDYVTKPGTAVPVDAEIEVVGLERRYVSRGGEKLAGALARFEIDVAGCCVLDAGASTGGFTDCLLQHGARRVYSVDVGFGQLRGSLAADPRVVPLERTNISDLRREALRDPIDWCVADLSYLSLAKSLPVLAALFDEGVPPRIVHLVKPLFEGVTRDRVEARPALHAMLERVVGFARDANLQLSGLMASPLLGTNGTVEFLGLFTRVGGSRPPPPPADLLIASLDEAARIASAAIA